MNSFELAVSDTEANLAYDFSPKSDVLLIAFAGWPGQAGQARYDFVRLSERLGVKRILVRDPARRFYLMGVPGLGGDVAGIVARLRELIERSGTERLVVVGNSMGGFSAALFGILLDADEIQSFAAKTSYLWHHRIWYWNFWQIRDVMLDLNLRYPGPKSHLDIKALLRTHPDFAGRLHFHYNRGHRLDRHSALRMGSSQQVELHHYPFEGHHVVRKLRDNGELERILQESLFPTA